jgi:hypothetical protein
MPAMVTAFPDIVSMIRVEEATGFLDLLSTVSGLELNTDAISAWPLAVPLLNICIM